MMVHRKEKVAIVALVLSAAVVHLFLVGKFAINLPFKDDYRVFVNYLYFFFHHERTVFVPDNESYPVLMRLITLAQYGIDGHLDFRHILWFCNLFVLVILLTLSAHFYRRKEYWNIAYVFLLVLNGMHHELYFRTDVSTYQTLSFALALYLFYGAAYYKTIGVLPRALFYVAFLLTPLGSVNGMLANVLVVLFFILNRENRKVWMATAVLLVIQLLAIFLSGDGKSFNVWENISKYNFQLVYAYFLSLGGILQVISNPAGWDILVLVSVAGFGYTFYRLFFPFRFRLDFEKMLFVFCGGSLALIVILRYNYWMEGYVSVLESRYKIYGALIVLLFFAALARRYRGMQPWIAAFLAGLFVVGLYKGTAMLKVQQMEQFTKAYNVDQDVYEQTYAQTFFIGKERKESLEAGGIFSFKPVREVAAKILVAENRLTGISQVKIGSAVADPLARGDWNSEILPLQRLEVDGVFPEKKYYFIRFLGADGRSSLHFLDPPPFSLLKGARPSTIRLLSRDFYPQALEGVDWERYEVYGVDDLGL